MRSAPNIMDISEGSAAGVLLEAFIIHRPKLVQIARRVLRCPYLAEDVVQDATLKATMLTGHPCVDCPLNFACQVVRNLAIDRERRRTLERSHAAPEALAETIEAPGADAAAHLNLVETMRVIAAAIGQLPERTRLVFERHRLHYVPQKTIAAELGVSPTLINFMVRDADAHCRACLRLAHGIETKRAPARPPNAAAPPPRAAATLRRGGRRGSPPPAGSR